MERLYYKGYWIEARVTAPDNQQRTDCWSVAVCIGKDHPTVHVLLSTLAGYQSQREARDLGVVRGKLLIAGHIWEGSQTLAMLDDPFLRSWCPADASRTH